jgi:hypothetical protein
MEKNVGSLDKTVRVAVGAVAGAASLGMLADAVPGGGLAALLLGVVAIAMLATGFLGTCGLYSVLGVDTR